MRDRSLSSSARHHVRHALGAIAALTASTVLAFVMPASARAQGTGTIAGHVTDITGGPLQGAMITLTGTQRGALVRSDGSYRVAVPAGRYEIHARLLGYVGRVDTVDVAAGATVEKNFALDKAAASLEAVTVLGTRGESRTVLSAPVPIDVLRSIDVRSTGRTETAQMIQAIAPSFNFPRTTLGDGTDNVRPATLRGLAPDQVLVLVNGKRQHLSALVNVNGFVGRGSEAVDLNAIPASMIDHIEILRDGAAAQYGSDAIAGVINIVLKSNTEGDFTVQTGENSSKAPVIGYRHDGKLFYTNLDRGWTFGSNGFLYVGGELRDRGWTNRAAPDTRQQYFTGDPRNSTPAQIDFRVGDSYTHDDMGWLNAGTTLSNGINVYAFGGASHRFGDAAGFWRRPMDDTNVRAIYPNGYLPLEQPVIWDGSGTVGAKGDALGWAYDLSSGYGRNAFDMHVVNSVNVSMGPSSPTTFYIGQLAFGQWTTNLDLNRDYHIGLNAPLHAAWGAEFREDEYKVSQGDTASYGRGAYNVLDANGNPTTRPAPVGSQVFPGFRPQDSGDHTRNNVAGYVDFSNDLTSQLLVDLAGRWEHYSDFGSTTTGKISGRYEPIKGYALRGAASTGFRAPSLGQEYFSSTAINFVNGVPLEIRTFPVNSVEARALNSKPLKPEKSTNYSLGVAMEPVSALSLTVDYYRVAVTDRIVLSNNFTGADVVAKFDSLGLPGLQGGRYFTNAIDTRTNGVDIVANYGWNISRQTLLRMTAGFNGNWTQVTRVDTSTVLGGHSAQLFDRVERARIEKGQPRNNLVLSADLSQDRWDFVARTHRYGQVTSYGTATSGANDETYGAKWVSDASVSFGPMKRGTITLGADNIFDVYPDQNLPQNSNSGILPFSGISPFGFNGRFVYAKLSVGL